MALRNREPGDEFISTLDVITQVGLVVAVIALAGLVVFNLVIDFIN